MKLGIAMAASNPMIATTIMISTSVKPPPRRSFVCILLPFLIRGVNLTEGGYYDFSFTMIACRQTANLAQHRGCQCWRTGLIARNAPIQTGEMCLAMSQCPTGFLDTRDGSHCRAGEGVVMATLGCNPTASAASV